MQIEPNARLGPYEIVAPIGAGGMGEVYKARDTRLDRIVALKILPDALASDPQFRERFDREARAVSQLTHPHICVLYDVGTEDGTEFLVMEYLEGETLEYRLKKGSLQLDQALQYAIQVADGLDKAHRAGIVHRDLKPGNVMLTRSGAKLLDFGLAKTGGPLLGAAARFSMLPTSPPGLTVPGAILGTFQYMAPEQIEGEESDARTDIFAFGCVLYEMLTGRKAFIAKTQASLISAILKDHPQPIADLQPSTPPALSHVVSACLAKAPDERWQHAGDIVRQLKWIAGNSTIAPSEPVRRSSLRQRAPLIVAAVLVLSTVGLGLIAWRGVGRSDRRAGQSMHLKLLLDPSQPISRIDAIRLNDAHTSVAVSPDGSRLVYVADQGGLPQLFVRDLSGNTASPIAGTEGAVAPFFSPDGQWIGFWVDHKLKKVALGGGAPVTLADAPYLRGAHWYAHDRIAFVPDLYAGIWRVDTSGGKPEQITMVDEKSGERMHRWPDVLPGGKAILFTVGTGGAFDDARIAVQSLETGHRQTLIERGSNPRYVPSGHLVYARAQALTAVPFDAVSLKVTGPPTKVADGVATEATGAAQFTFAATGVFVAMPPVSEEGQAVVVWVDRSGNVTRAPGAPGTFDMIAVAPVGHRIVVGDSRSTGLSVRDLRRGTETVLTSGARVNGFAWLPDGSRVVFGSERAGAWNLMWKRVDGIGDEEPLLPPGRSRSSMNVARDGRQLVYTEQTANGDNGVWLMSLPERKPAPLPGANGDELNPDISPDGRYLASAVGSDWQSQVFIQALPSGGQRWQASTGGGTEPRWSIDGRELYYRNRDQMLAVSFTGRGSVPDIGTPRVLFEGRFVTTRVNSYSVGPDGRFLMLQPLSDPKPLVTLDVITNWFAELARLTAHQK